MKSVIIKMIIIIFMSILIATLIGCSSSIDRSHKLIWEKEDLLIIKVASEEGEDANVSQYKTTVEMKPKYYKGSMPFSYTVAFAPGGIPGGFGVVSMSGVPMLYEFKYFTNLFVSDESDSYIIGVSTMQDEKIVAEARLLPNDNGANNKLQIEEFHYNSNGDLIFKCKSQFDSLGFKIGETETKGKKTTDYYFLWPSQ